MMTASGWDEVLPELQAKLLRQAQGFGADVTAAEDLVQEALFEAWRFRDRIYDPTGVDRWLSVILRNVRLRSLRRDGREASHFARPVGGLDGSSKGGAADVSFDVEVELERRELAQLLDRAMGTLPDGTRDVLAQRFIEDKPVHEMASRMGLTPGALRMRLQRGKAGLREALTTTYRADALAYGLIHEAERGWTVTRIWCPQCGAVRLHGRFREPGRQMEMLCPNGCEMTVTADEVIYGGVKGFRPALKRTMASSYEFFRDNICGLDRDAHPVTVHRGLTPCGIHEVWVDGVHEFLPRVTTTLSAQALSSPEGREFWQDHPRIKLTNYTGLETDGEPAVLTTFTSVPGAARLDIVLSVEGFRVMRAQRR